MTAAIAPNYEKLADVLLLPSTVKTFYLQHYKAILKGFFYYEHSEKQSRK